VARSDLLFIRTFDFRTGEHHQHRESAASSRLHTGSPKLFFVINVTPGSAANGEKAGRCNGRPSHRVVIVVPTVTLVNLSRQKVTSASCSRRGHKKILLRAGAQMKPYRYALTATPGAS